MDPEPSAYLTQLETLSYEPSLIGLSLFFILLMIISALISASEVAFFSLDVNDLKNLEDAKTSFSKMVLNLKEKPKRLLATILIVNNFVNIAIVIVAGHIVNILFHGDRISKIALWFQDYILFGNFTEVQIGNGINFMITVVGVTSILVLFGEAVPKIYSTLNKFAIINVMARPLSLLTRILHPLTSILVKWSSLFESKLKNSNNNNTSREDIDAAIDLTITNLSESTSQEADILKGIISFSDTAAKQIMRPRIDIIALDIKMSFKEVIKIVKESGYSRLPVYEEDLDKIQGILYLKDLLQFIDADDDFLWQNLIRKEVLFVPESKKIDELLREFQSKRNHICIVVDEYGGTTGIATLEDIMEEIVGDIKDEFDEAEEIQYLKISENNYIFDGKTLLNDVCRIIGINISSFDQYRGESDSIAGLLLEITGGIPPVDKEVSMGGVTLKVISITKKRIEKVSILIHENN